jgi:hypothetical protein
MGNFLCVYSRAETWSQTLLFSNTLLFCSPILLSYPAHPSYSPMLTHPILLCSPILFSYALPPCSPIKVYPAHISGFPLSCSPILLFYPALSSYFLSCSPILLTGSLIGLSLLLSYQACPSQWPGLLIRFTSNGQMQETVYVVVFY